MRKTSPKFFFSTKTKNQICPEPDCDFKTCDPGSLTRHRKRHHRYVPKPRRRRATVPARDASQAESVPSTEQLDSSDVEDRDELNSESVATGTTATVYTVLTPPVVLPEARRMDIYDLFGQWSSNLVIDSSPQPKLLSPAYQSASPLESSSATDEMTSPSMFVVFPTAPKAGFLGSLKLNEVGEDVVDLSSVSVIVLALFVGLAWTGSYWFQIKCDLNMVPESDPLQATLLADEYDAAAGGDEYDLESTLDDNMVARPSVIENGSDSSATY